MQKWFTNSLILKILLYFVILQLKNCMCENMTVEQESSLSKPFGSLEDDWKRLDLLQSLQPKNSVLRADLVKACRLLLNALYQSTSFVNPVEEYPDKMAPDALVRNYNNSVESYKNSTRIDDSNLTSRLIVTTERLLRLYNRSEENDDVINLQYPNTDDNRKLKPMINNHDSLKSRPRGGNSLSTLLPFNNDALFRNSNNGDNLFKSKNTLNAFDKPVDVAGFGNGANSFKPDNLDHGRINKTTKNAHSEMKKTNSSARCGKTDNFTFPAHEFNWTDSLSTTESEMSLQYFNINIFQNTYIGSTTNTSINKCSKLAPTEVIPLRHSELEDRSLVEKVGVTNKKHDSCDSLQARNVIDNVPSIDRKVGLTNNDNNSSNYTKNDLIKGLKVLTKVEDPTLKSVERAIAGSRVLSNSTAGRETFFNNISSIKDSSLNSSIFSDRALDLNENLHQEMDSLDKNQGVLLTFNDKVLPNITAVNNGQLMTVPQEQVEQIADLDRVVQKFLDSLYNGSIDVKKDDGSMLQDNNILILQGNLTDEKTLGAVRGETKDNLKYPSTNQSNVMSNKGGDQENLKSSNISQQIDNGTKENLKQPSNYFHSDQSSNVSKENSGEMMQVDLKQSSSSNVCNATSNEAYGGEHVNLKPLSNAKSEESSSNKVASELQGKLTQTTNVGNNKVVEEKQSSNRSVDFGSCNNDLLHETVTQALLKQSDAIFGLENNHSDNSSSLLTGNQGKNTSFSKNADDKAIEEHFKPSSLNQNNELMYLSRDNVTTNLTTSNKQCNQSTNLKSDYDEMRDNPKYSSSNQTSNQLTSLKGNDNLTHLKPSSTNETHLKIIPSHDNEMNGNLTESSFYQSEKLTNSGVYDNINNIKPSSSLTERNAYMKSQKDEIKSNNSMTSKCNHDLTLLNNFDDIVKTPTAASNNNNSAGSELSDLKDQVNEIGGSQLFSNNSDNNKLTNKDTENSSLSPINQRNELVSLGGNYSNVVQLSNKNDLKNTISSRNNSNSIAKEASNNRIISKPLKISNSTINEKSTNISKLHSNGVDNSFGKSTLSSIDEENLSNKPLESEDYLDVSTKRSETCFDDSHKQGTGNEKLVTSIPESNESIWLTNSSKNAPLSACGDPKDKLNNDKNKVDEQGMSFE
ncbi:hypothetical protein LSTR_LSTR007918 [Laodelphax striatellus]|uniref:Uncharacterized protein n=1 Tax=Laodelphax striatellus TaxID=195883 RepID=A0A482XJX5_LAOST|nr:hypothetical protein LSTR_LSTR007918 [Laodelphax striatellus]